MESKFEVWQMDNGEIKGETGTKEYHVLSLSGGKDSTALAFFIRDNMPEVHEQIEYVFCDTEHELPETYEYLDKIEVFLDKPIERLKPYKSFEHLLEMHNYLPSPHRRWCTIELKTKPFRKYVYDKFSKNGEGVINLYIGIRSDEMSRAAFNKYGDNYIQEVYPFVDSGINKKDVMDILEKSGIGLPDYYSWIDRSGCYFCFFKSKMKWINLYENHPDLYEKAIKLESSKIKDGGFGWNIDFTLKDMIKPENAKKIRENYEKLQAKRAEKRALNMPENSLFEYDSGFEENKCLFCHI